MNSLYLDLLERCLLNTIHEDPPMDPWAGPLFREELRATGRDWPSQAHTMIGQSRLHQLRLACETLIREGVPGDFIETGVWRGGACILMRGVLRAHGVANRRVWCADSFQGLPRPDAATYPADRDDPHHSYTALAVGLEEVRRNFARFDLLDDQVCFLQGWFRDTLPAAPVDRLALLRLDGDMYESTAIALRSLYDRLSPGAYVIVDDYGAVPACRAAVDDFRRERGIELPMTAIDWTGMFWRTPAAG